MKKMILVSLLVATSTHAQWAPNHAAALEDLKTTRKQMEANTESQILERLEAARLADEKNRRQKFEELNFSVVNDSTQTSTPVTTF